jgi:CheY-like chemotaxis protein
MPGPTTEAQASNDRLLVIDDEAQIARIIVDVAVELGFDVRAASDVAAFKATYEHFSPAAIVMDILMPGEDGIELLKYLASRGCRSRIVILSGGGAEIRRMAKELGEAYRLNVVANLRKPIRIAELREQLIALKPAAA